MTRVYIAIGSNIGSPQDNVIQAIEAIKCLPDSQFIGFSSLYKSKPMGPCDQADYVNAVAAIETTLHPLALLDKTQQIELDFGRKRKKEDRWGPRTLDLDILLYGNENIKSDRLTVPHYGMKEREFVLYPLFELAPDLHLPGGCKLADLLSAMDKNGLTVIAY